MAEVPIPRRAVIFAAPIAVGVAIVGSGLAWLLAIQFTTREARGARVHLDVTAACDVVPTLRARLDDFGLAPSVSAGGIDFTLPGLEDDRAHMSAVLAEVGQLAVDGQTLVPNHAGVQISLQGGAVTLLTLDVAPKDNAAVLLDNRVMEVVQQNGGELQIAAWADNSSDALRTATDRAVILRHPLPCAVTLAPLVDLP